MEWSLLVMYAREIGASALAGLSYSVTGWLNHWVEMRKQNADAQWDWKKMGATLTVAVIVGILIGLWQMVTGQDVATAYAFIISIGLNTLIRKWVSILWYGRERMLDRLVRVFN